MYLTTVSAGNGKRAIKNMVTQEIVATYDTGNLASRQQADAAAKADWADMLNDLIGAGLIVAGREYSLPNLQTVYQKFLTL